VASALLGAPAFAQEPNPNQLRLTANCGPIEELLAALADDYGEYPTNRGIAENGGKPFGPAIVTSNQKTGTFTVILGRPDGKGCVVLAGSGWEALEAGKPGSPA
jgi:hypothetical protein